MTILHIRNIESLGEKNEFLKHNIPVNFNDNNIFLSGL